MRVIITGSRDWEGRLAEFEIHSVLDKLEKMAEKLRSPLVIVHGGCPTGADAIVDRWATRRDYEPEVHEVNWKTGGKAAGMFRNTHMVNLGAAMCIGFIRNGSPGTLDCLNKALAAGIPTYPILWEGTLAMEPVEELTFPDSWKQSEPKLESD